MGNTQRLKGTTYDKAVGRWKARVRIGGVLYHLGSYPTMEDAYEAYTACVNFPDPLSYAMNFRNSSTWGQRKYSAVILPQANYTTGGIQ